MKKSEILKLYIGDLKCIVESSPGRDNRIAMLQKELKQALNMPVVVPSFNFEAIAQKLNDGDVSVWTDGIAVSSDNAPEYCAYRLKAYHFHNSKRGIGTVFNMYRKKD